MLGNSETKGLVFATFVGQPDFSFAPQRPPVAKEKPFDIRKEKKDLVFSPKRECFQLLF